MRIAAILSVKDELELILPALNHLISIGVDEIIVCDLNSTDGTIETVNAHKYPVDIRIIHADDSNAETLIGTSEVSWFSITKQAALDSRSDWIYFLDCDEFLLPASGNIKDVSSLLDSDVLQIDRFNVPVTRGGLDSAALFPINYRDIRLITTKVDHSFRDKLRINPELVWIFGNPGPKVLCRPQFLDGLAVGAHDVRAPPGSSLRKSTPFDLIIAHLPFTSRSRFLRKVSSIKRYYVPDKQPKRGWHWARWAQLEAEGKIEEEFDRNLFTCAAMQELQRSGIIQSAHELFLERHAKVREGQMALLDAEVRILTSQLADCWQRLADCRQRTEELTSSRSWRLTAPLRKVAHGLRWLRRGHLIPRSRD